MNGPAPLNVHQIGNVQVNPDRVMITDGRVQRLMEGVLGRGEASDVAAVSPLSLSTDLSRDCRRCALARATMAASSRAVRMAVRRLGLSVLFSGRRPSAWREIARSWQQLAQRRTLV